MATTNTAQLVRKLTGFTGSAALYKLDPPVPSGEYVVVSASTVPYSGPETYIFPATADGEISDWGELDGSFKGALDHAEALEGAGYRIA